MKNINDVERMKPEFKWHEKHEMPNPPVAEGDIRLVDLTQAKCLVVEVDVILEKDDNGVPIKWGKALAYKPLGEIELVTNQRNVLFAYTICE